MFPALKSQIHTLLANQDKPLLIAIDGPAGAGKSSLAAALQQDFTNSLMIHADDFFLQPHQRTPARLNEPGGNLDRERLLAQVLIPLQSGSYQGHQRYNCQTGALEAVPGRARPLIIIEGSYSHHPDLRAYYDLTVFLAIDKETQLQRLKARCPDQASFERFKSRWIPLENAYFERFRVKESSDLVL